MSIKSKIQSLISAANNATGESDTTLTDAVQTLVDGYGQGGGGGSLPSVISKIDGGSFTLASDTLTGSYTVRHNLGIMPTNVMVWSDDVTYDPSARVTAAFAIYSGNYFVAQYNTNGTNREIRGAVISGDLSENSFRMTASGNYYKAGSEYKWLAWA